MGARRSYRDPEWMRAVADALRVLHGAKTLPEAGWGAVAGGRDDRLSAWWNPGLALVLLPAGDPVPMVLAAQRHLVFHVEHLPEATAFFVSQAVRAGAAAQLRRFDAVLSREAYAARKLRSNS